LSAPRAPEYVPQKPAPHLMRGGNRSCDEDMLKRKNNDPQRRGMTAATMR
jgi:hypothetical protein